MNIPNFPIAIMRHQKSISVFLTFTNLTCPHCGLLIKAESYILTNLCFEDIFEQEYSFDLQCSGNYYKALTVFKMDDNHAFSSALFLCAILSLLDSSLEKLYISVFLIQMETTEIEMPGIKM